MDAVERIREITNKWFLSEPLLFGIYCTHKQRENKSLEIPFRTGKGFIEYNSTVINSMNQKALTEALTVECLRIVLKHPYQRVPSYPVRPALAIASDITIKDNYSLEAFKLTSAKDLNLPNSLCYEEYYAKIKNEMEQIQQNIQSNSDNNSDQDSDQNDEDGSEGQDGESNEEMSQLNQAINQAHQMKNAMDSKYGNIRAKSQESELWAEDDEMSSKINSEIEKAQITNQWGTIGGNMKQMIEASLIVPMNYKDMFTHFRTNILSSSRRSTRQRPNRRYEFDYPGNTRNFTTKLLVGVDTSGSVSDKQLQEFFSIVNRFFKYGIEQIDVIQFDAELKEDILSLKKAKKQVEITGRGGTDAQPAIDYYETHQYDGLIMFTDGYFSTPHLNRWSERILWVLTSKEEYDNFCKTHLDHLPGSRATYIPS